MVDAYWQIGRRIVSRKNDKKKGNGKARINIGKAKLFCIYQNFLHLCR